MANGWKNKLHQHRRQYETADRSWELKAIKLIRQFLQDAMPDVPIIA